MKKIILAVLLAGTVAITSCNKSEDPDEQNQNPGSFTASTSNISSTTADLSWTAATDPNGDGVTYSIEGSTGFSGQETFTTTGNTAGTFSGLTAETNYSGSVIASDGNGGSSSATFSFTTTAGQSGNQAPGSFSVTVGTLSNSTADLSWTASVDPDGDNISYEIELDGTSEETGVTATSYELNALSGGIEYSGKVIATDGNGGSTESSFTFTTYVIDISLFEQGAGDCVGGNNCLKSIALVDCDFLEGGGSGPCYEITYYSNPIDDDGPFCPETVNETGGIGNYDGDGIANGGTQNGDAVGLSRLNGALFMKMENDGYDIIDEDGNITIETVVPGGGRVGQMMPTAACLQPAPDDNLELTFQIPVYPENLGTADDITSVEYIGLALDGIPINGAPPSVVDNNGKIPSLDRCGVHHDPSGYLHWHFVGQNMNDVLQSEGLYEEGVFECEKITQDPDALIGFARDGYPIYSSDGDTETNPAVLDDCNGHIAETAEYPEGIYHYHATTDAPNVPTCIVGRQALDAFAKPM